MVDEQLTVGIGAATRHLVDQVVDLGPLHPSAHGGYRIRLTLTADRTRVVAAEPLVGLLHRGAEKLFEVRDYRQILALANRHDWLAATCNEITVALAVERMVGMDVPPRAAWLRTLLCELNRAMAHLVFLAPATRAADGAATVATDRCTTAREAVQAVLEEAGGGRIHHMVNRVGGLREDVPAGWTGRVGGALDEVDRAHDTLDRLLDDPAFAEPRTGVGVLRRADALALGVTGPAGRASGVDLDLRRDDPALAYGLLSIPVVTDAGGDALARTRCQVGELATAVTLGRHCLAALPDGPVNVRLPKAVVAPEGSVYRWTEAPLGVAGVHLVSRGERTPWRLRLRTPSFNNVQALSALLPGTAVTDLSIVLASLAIVVGDIDK